MLPYTVSNDRMFPIQMRRTTAVGSDWGDGELSLESLRQKRWTFGGSAGLVLPHGFCER